MIKLSRLTFFSNLKLNKNNIFNNWKDELFRKDFKYTFGNLLKQDIFYIVNCAMFCKYKKECQSRLEKGELVICKKIKPK
jgi:hypothetical protein